MMNHTVTLSLILKRKKILSNNFKKHELISTSGFERISLSGVTMLYKE